VYGPAPWAPADGAGLPITGAVGSVGAAVAVSNGRVGFGWGSGPGLCRLGILGRPGACGLSGQQHQVRCEEALRAIASLSVEGVLCGPVGGVLF